MKNKHLKNKYKTSVQKSQQAFTVIELIVVTAIVGSLISLGLFGVRMLNNNAAKVREISAAKNLIAAYLLYPQENNGRLLVSHYEGSNPDIDKEAITLPDGKILDGGTLHRYPYRLAQYFNFQMDGTILVNKNATQIHKNFEGSMWNYGVSLCPALGINYYFVGGYMVDGESIDKRQTDSGYDSEILTRLVQAHTPASLVVFASAFTPAGEQEMRTRVDGRFGVEPPRWTTALWNQENGQNVHVDPRYDGKAVVAFLAGNVGLHTVDELMDMRMWSNQAAIANDPNYTVPMPVSSGIGKGGGRR